MRDESQTSMKILVFHQDPQIDHCSGQYVCLVPYKVVSKALLFGRCFRELP